MTVDGWHVNATDKQDATAHAQWLLVEQTDDTTIRLRGAEKEGRYFNFDRHTAGSFVYSDKTRPEMKLLLRNYALSDDIAFRFSDRGWMDWPLTADKYVEKLKASAAVMHQMVEHIYGEDKQ